LTKERPRSIRLQLTSTGGSDGNNQNGLCGKQAYQPGRPSEKGETVVIVTDTDRPRIITQALAYSADFGGRESGRGDDGASGDRGGGIARAGCGCDGAAQVVINQSTYASPTQWPSERR